MKPIVCARNLVEVNHKCQSQGGADLRLLPDPRGSAFQEKGVQPALHACCRGPAVAFDIRRPRARYRTR